MNKIYNNLNIENLIKTEWFNQFERKQRIAIKDGLKDNLDVSIYANPEIDWKEMLYFNEELKKNSNVSIYTGTKYKEEKIISFKKKIKNIFLKKYKIYKDKIVSFFYSLKSK